MSNLTIPSILKKFALTEILEPTIIVTRSHGVKANRYLVCKSSTKQFVRHSTTDINDGRNSFGIRYTLSFILEGLIGLTKEDRIWERAKHQLTLIENFLKICNEKSREISKLVNEIRNKFEEQIPDSIIIQADYTKNFSKTLNAVLKRTSDLKDTTIILPDYRPQPEAVVVVKRPDAYIIEKPSPQVIDIIKYQQIEYRLLTSIETFSVEKFLISGRDTLNYEGRKTVIPAGSFLHMEKTFQPGDMMVLVNNIRANQIMQILEPQSFYGLSHYEEFQFLLKENVYPIYRLVN